MPAGVTYTFHRCLGRGGFGEVYLASRKAAEGLEKRVAVKVLRSDLAENELALARLKDEAKLLALLDHPAIVRVLELTRLAGQVALVTEYVDGTDLARFCAPAKRLPPKVVLGVVAEVAGALDCASTTPSPATGKPLRLVHRDIKPENIRLSRHGEAKLLDFGIARSPEVAREARTNTGNLPFTPGYTAPEAFVALRQEPATDIFALGATLFRLLAGERFYEGVRLADQAALSCAPAKYADYLDGRLVQLGAALDPEDGGPADDRELVALVRACLAYDPVHRPTARALQGQAEAVAERLEGMAARRYVREVPLPEDRPVEGGALVGRILQEDEPGGTTSFERVRSEPRTPDAPTRISVPPRPSAPPPTPSAPGPSMMPMVGMAVAFGMLAFVAVVLAAIAFAMGWWMGG